MLRKNDLRSRGVWIALGVAACAPGSSSKQPDQPVTLADDDKSDGVTGAAATGRRSIEGSLDFGTQIPTTAPNTLLNRGDRHLYEFQGLAGGVITIAMHADDCNKLDTLLSLFPPPDPQVQLPPSLIDSDDAGDDACFTDSRIDHFTLPQTGTYQLIATSYLRNGGGTYGLSLTCENGACSPDGALNLAKTRIAQSEIDAGMFAVADLFEMADFLFGHNFSMAEGLGNGLTGLPAGPGPRPNMRKVHFGGFGGPDSTNCVTCHNVGGEDGGGDSDSNIFQAGDGVNKSSALLRNAPQVLGGGFKQQLGIEMTGELQGELAQAKAAVAQSGAAQTVTLTSKGVSFGQVTVAADGTVDASGLQGLDPDLVVKPFGVKGREATLRRFVEGGFRVHFSMAPDTQIAKHCANPIPQVVGNGPDCHDPDADGIASEITEGQLTLTALYGLLLEIPVRVAPFFDVQQQQAAAGEQLFHSLGCAGCHVPTMTLNNPVHQEFPDLTGGPPLAIDLRTQTAAPRPPINADGSMTVELFSDLKRHDMGQALADQKPFNQIPASHFITAALWGVNKTPPYLHDGRANTLRDAILAHGGEAQAARDAFNQLSSTDKKSVQVFLQTLSRVDRTEEPGSHP
jgi:mono/diheme cytochrome c family protein